MRVLVVNAGSSSLKLAVLDGYHEREELGEIHADATATMNERRAASLRAEMFGA